MGQEGLICTRVKTTNDISKFREYYLQKHLIICLFLSQFQLVNPLTPVAH